jgi:hypothetical protein
VPAKKVLVVTLLSWLGASSSTNLILGVDGATDPAWLIIGNAFNDSGEPAGTVELPNLVIKPGNKLCAVGTPVGLGGILVAGFLTKDK